MLNTHLPATIRVALGADGVDYEFQMFRAHPEGYFESFSDYCNRVLMPVLRDSELSMIRCSMSGYAIATITENEWVQIIKGGVEALSLTRFDDLLGRLDVDAVRDGMESLVDHIRTTIILTQTRRAPSLAFQRGRFVLAALSPDRQLAILLNQFLLDSGKFREKAIGLEDMLERNIRAFRIADSVSVNFLFSTELQNLRLALIELDAKYRISMLSFNKKEIEKLQAIRQADTLNPVDVTQLVMEMTAWRDEHSQLETSTHWTNRVLAHEGMTRAQQIATSNILVPDEEGPRVPRKPSGSTGPLTGEAKVKHEQKAMMRDLIAAAFGVPKS